MESLAKLRIDRVHDGVRGAYAFPRCALVHRTQLVHFPCTSRYLFLRRCHTGSMLAFPCPRLAALGISVFWGMATSAIACVSLTLCQIQFFFKFGLFFLLTILWAYLWSSLFMLSVRFPICGGPRSPPEPNAQSYCQRAQPHLYAQAQPHPCHPRVCTQVLAWVGPEPRKGNEGINSRVMA
eukprot:3764531-Prymnesium_polylepis.2